MLINEFPNKYNFPFLLLNGWDLRGGGGTKDEKFVKSKLIGFYLKSINTL